MRRSLLVLLSLLQIALLLCLSGCWDRREINELAVISALGVDKEDDIWKITAEVFQPTTGGGEDGSAGGGGGSSKRQVWIAQGRDYTILGALREMALKVPRRVYAAHTSAILIGEEVARQGILEFLDLWERDSEARINTEILACRGKAEEIIIGSQGGLEKSVGLELSGLKRFAPVNGHSTILSVHEFIAFLGQKGADPFTGVVELRTVPSISTAGGGKSSGSTAQALRLKGLALFRDDKLMGFADPTESRGILAIQGKIASTILHVQATVDENQKDNTVALEVNKLKKQIKIEENEGQPIIKIKITAEMGLAEQAYHGDLMQADDIRFLERQAATVISNEVEKAIQLTKNLGLDPCGFGEIMRRQKPKLWEQLEKNWPEGLRDIDVSLDSQARVRYSALTGLPPIEKR
ncbi:MAG TPA: Ger(x)C family spore germination protein [Firmicutes bacterium]|nr:Ger(x)C family spore germination protein [Bacillota bacterium]